MQVEATISEHWTPIGMVKIGKRANTNCWRECLATGMPNAADGNAT